MTVFPVEESDFLTGGIFQDVALSIEDLGASGHVGDFFEIVGVRENVVKGSGDESEIQGEERA